MDDDGRQPIAIGHLSDLSDLKKRLAITKFSILRCPELESLSVAQTFKNYSTSHATQVGQGNSYKGVNITTG